MGKKEHWEGVYASNPADLVSWFQEQPSLSLQLIENAAANVDARILDVGGGASLLVDRLLDTGFHHAGVLDIAESALAVAKTRLGDKARLVEWFHADITSFESPHSWDVWHDRAAFHFLVEAGERMAYRQILLRSLAPGGSAVMATFGPEGPTRCSGLDAMRYSPGELHATLGPDFVMVEEHEEVHRTPSGTLQQFIYCWFRRFIELP
jgi:SAM-dependent methyltransferase